MGSFENKLKSFERRYGINLRSLRRSRKFTTIVTLILLLILYLLYKYTSYPRKYGLEKYNLNDCLKEKLNKFSSSIDNMNTVISQEGAINTDYDNEHTYVPFTGNGFIGLSLNSKQGIHAYYLKSLSLGLKYNPLTSVYLDNMWRKNEATVIEIQSGLVHKIQCFQNDNKDCITITNTLFAHRTRPSIIIEEINLNNPTREIVTIDLIQIGAIEWNTSNTITETYNNHEYTITSGIINVKSDLKDKQICLSIASTKLPTNAQLKSHDLNLRFNTITVVKYSKTLLNTKTELLASTVNDLEKQVRNEFKEAVDIGAYKLKQEHVNTWNKIWKTGFSISESLAANTLNGDQINSTIYYLLCSHRAPLHEIIPNYNNTNEINSLHQLQLQMDRCYEGISTLQATKLWQAAKNENDIGDLNSLWYLTLTKNGCTNFLKLGVDGTLQAIVLSFGLKFSNHHLELNLDPKQLHRNYMFRNINYANLTYFNISVEVDTDDNHAKLYVTMDQVVSNKDFYACDAGCIDDAVKLVSKIKHEFPVKQTNPITAILYLTDDKVHASQLKHILHVKEVEIAPPQDVNSVALHKHGHYWAGLSIIFWTLFVFLLLVFHLFLCKLIFREMFRSSYDDSSDTQSNYRYSRTRAV